MIKKWDKGTQNFPGIIKAGRAANTVNGIGKDQMIAFKKGETNTPNTAELVDYADTPDGEIHIWKKGDVFHNKYFTIKHYTGETNKYQDTGMYLTANGMDDEPTVKVKQSKKICHLGFHIINYLK